MTVAQMKTLTLLAGVVLGSTLLLDVPAVAQVEEIIVTARKRAEPLQKTPVSITAFTEEQLAKPGLNDVGDVSRYAPNVIIDRGAGNTGGSFNSQVFIRGVGQVDFLFSSDPGVGVYVDEVYLPRVVGSIMDVMDIARIEVLRGPQGTLYGKNTIGGALNITSQMPGDKFGLAADLTTGSRSRIDGKLSLDLPMIDNTRLSHGERCAVSLTQLTTTPPTVQMAIAYFPGSRASLKDKPYYDEVIHDLVNEKQSSEAKEH